MDMSWLPLMALVMALLLLTLLLHRQRVRNQQLARHYASMVRQRLQQEHAADDVDADVVVVGAGAIGCTIAAALAKQKNRRIVVVEREFGPRERFVGELLQPGGVQALQRLGLGAVLDDIDAVRVPGYHLYSQRNSVDLEYEPGHTAASFHHGEFVQALRQRLRSLSNVKLVQGTVVQLQHDREFREVTGVVYKESEGGRHQVQAYLTVLCDGPMSSLRKHIIDNDASSRTTLSRFVAIELERSNDHRSGKACVILTSSTPILYYPLSSTSARMLVDVRPSASVQEHMHGQVRQNLPEFLLEGFDKAMSNGSPMKSMPNQTMQCRPMSIVGGVLLIGDALNMRHPLTGGGMTVGFRDVEHFASLLDGMTCLDDRTSLNEIVQQFYRERGLKVATINILADALYEVVTGPFTEVFLDYLIAFNQAFSRGPMLLLSCLSTSQAKLLYHFFGCALFGCAQECILRTSSKSVSRCVEFLREALRIIAPVLQRHRARPVMQSLANVAASIMGLETNQLN